LPFALLAVETAELIELLYVCVVDRAVDAFPSALFAVETAELIELL